MSDTFTFDDGFFFNPNPLDGWSYLTTNAWHNDFKLLNALSAVDPKTTEDMLSPNYTSLKAYQLFCKLNNPNLINIILKHYNINISPFLLSAFLNFLLTNVDVVMTEMADCVHVKMNESPFDYLPLKELFEEYQYILGGNEHLCCLLKPKNSIQQLLSA